jgi:hypothetical protein
VTREFAILQWVSDDVHALLLEGRHAPNILDVARSLARMGARHIRISVGPITMSWDRPRTTRARVIRAHQRGGVPS